MHDITHARRSLLVQLPIAIRRFNTLPPCPVGVTHRPIGKAETRDSPAALITRDSSLPLLGGQSAPWLLGRDRDFEVRNEYVTG
jgi:hypothetical protein